MLDPVKKFAKALRGGAHPLEIGVSVAMGVLAGVVLGTNGLAAVLIVLMLVVNTNKPAFGLTVAACGAAGWLAAPAKFAVGRAALSSDAVAGVFARAANARVGALMGFDTYSVAGGIVLGVPLAVVAGAVAYRITRGFKLKMLGLVGDPEKLKAWMKGRMARLVKWVTLGVGEADYEGSLNARPRVIRKSGLVMLLILSGLTAAAALVDYGPLARPSVQQGLTDLAGAQADVASIGLRPLVASFRAEGLALTDAAEPSTNTVEVGAISADISVADLLRRSLVIEEARVEGVAFGTARSSPGEVTRPPAAEGSTAKAPAPSPLEGAKSVESYIAKWKELEAKFEKLQEILAKIDEYRSMVSGSEAAPATGEPMSDEEIARRVAADGYAAIRAPEVVRSVPDFLVKRLVAGPVPTGVEQLPSVKVTVTNLAYPARFGPGPVTATVSADQAPMWRASGEQGPLPWISLSFDPEAASEPIKLSGRVLGPAKLLSDALSSAVPVAFDGGKMDVSLDGTAGADWLDLALDVKVVGFTARSRGSGGLLGIRGKDLDRALAEMTEMRFKVLVRGRPSRPRILFRPEGLGEALKDAAARALKKRGQEEIDRQKEKLEEKLREKTGGKLDETKEKGKKLLEGLFNRK